jgi:hypothetical protein
VVDGLGVVADGTTVEPSRILASTVVVGTVDAAGSPAGDRPDSSVGSSGSSAPAVNGPIAGTIATNPAVAAMLTARRDRRAGRRRRRAAVCTADASSRATTGAASAAAVAVDGGGGSADPGTASCPRRTRSCANRSCADDVRVGPLRSMADTRRRVVPGLVT